MKLAGPLVLFLGIVGAIVLSQAVYIVQETEQYVITQFGKEVGAPVTEPGLNFKVPFLHTLHRFDKRFLEWDGDRDEVPTKDKRFIWVDTYARWRISDPLQYFKSVSQGEPEARRRLNDILDGLTRDVIAAHDLIEVVRDTDRGLAAADDLDDEQTIREIPKIETGRSRMEQMILEGARPRTKDLGIEVLDFRIKRLNYVDQVRQKVFARMISERQRIAERFRSEGEGEAARINGEKERELKEITSEAYRTAEEIRGKADAEAADIYAEAFSRDAEFYRFMKTMEVYRQTMDAKTMLLLSSDNDLLKYLDSAK